jgi:hypothetical protein
LGDTVPNPRADCRLHPINHAYLEELARLGPYGTSKSAVMRRFLEDGIGQAIKDGMIEKKNIDDYGGVEKED